MARRPIDPKADGEAKVVAFTPAVPMLPSFEDADEADERRDDIYAGGAPLPDVGEVRGRAKAILGSLETIDFIAITGKEFWSVFDKEPARTVFEAYARASLAKVGDIVLEIDEARAREAL